MFTQIGVGLLMAGAAPVGLPAQVVSVPLAVDPLIRKVSVVRQAARFRAPAAALDLRRMGRGVELLRMTRAVPRAASYDVADRPGAADEPRLDPLARDRGLLLTGYQARNAKMAAGLSLRMTAADGVLASEVGMAGSVGRALSRFAQEAVAAR